MISTLHLLVLVHLAVTDTVVGARDSRHMIFPVLGYQVMSGETGGFTYSTQSYDLFRDTLVTISQDYDYKYEEKAPVLGLVYQFNPNRRLAVEASLSSIHNKTNHKQLIRFEQSGFNTRSRADVTRKNLLLLGLDAAYNLPVKVVWLMPAVRLGVGYAWRNVGVKVYRDTETATIKDADALFTLRGGVDVILWRGNTFIMQGSLQYARFIPLEGDSDSFGGIGWRLGIFPFWSLSRKAEALFRW